MCLFGRLFYACPFCLFIYLFVHLIFGVLTAISLEFVPEGYFVDEDASSLEVCALVADAPEPTQAPFSVNFGSQDLTATSGECNASFNHAGIVQCVTSLY